LGIGFKILSSWYILWGYKFSSYLALIDHLGTLVFGYVLNILYILFWKSSMYLNMLTEVVCLYILLYLGDTVCKQKDFKRSLLGCVCVFCVNRLVEKLRSYFIVTWASEGGDALTRKQLIELWYVVRTDAVLWTIKKYRIWKV